MWGVGCWVFRGFQGLGSRVESFQKVVALTSLLPVSDRKAELELTRNLTAATFNFAKGAAVCLEAVERTEQTITASDVCGQKLEYLTS